MDSDEQATWDEYYIKLAKWKEKQRIKALKLQKEEKFETEEEQAARFKAERKALKRQERLDMDAQEEELKRKKAEKKERRRLEKE